MRRSVLIKKVDDDFKSLNLVCWEGDQNLKFRGQMVNRKRNVVFYCYHCDVHGDKTFTSRELEEFYLKQTQRSYGH